MPLDMSELNRIGAARATIKSDYFRDGHGVAVVDELIYDKMNGGLTFVARCQIVESASKGDIDPKTRQPAIPNASGSLASWVQVYQPNIGMEGRVKAFVLAITDQDEAAVDAVPGAFGKALFDLTQGREQPAKGMVVCYSSFQYTTKKGVTQTGISWSPAASANTPEKIKARRAKLLAGQKITAEDC